MKIIPAIDIINGQCVRLEKGNYKRKKIYSKSPVEIAKKIEDTGIEHLHLVDLDGAKTQQIINLEILAKICEETSLKVDFGGGIKTINDLELAFNAGANQVSCGSVAVHKPEEFEGWISRYGPERIILGADCKNRKIATMGWKTIADIDVIEFIEHYQTKGIKEVICTDIEQDGMLKGSAISLYEEIIAKTDVALIASGGVNSIKNLFELEAIGCAGVIIGKALYEERITLKELAEYVKK